MRVNYKGAAALLVAALAVGGGAWLSQPEPLSLCLAPLVASDQAAANDNPELVMMGEAAELQGAKRVDFSRGQFLSCTRYKALSLDWPPADLAKAAFVELKSAPSFEYGRHRVLARKEAPGLKEEELTVTARIMRAASSLAEAKKQLMACPGLAAKDTTALADFEQLSDPYLAAVLWSIGVAHSAEEARDGAGQLAAMTREAAETPACTDKRMSDELKTLRQFKAGQLPDLPCHVTMADGEPELHCGN